MPSWAGMGWGAVKWGVRGFRESLFMVPRKAMKSPILKGAWSVGSVGHGAVVQTVFGGGSIWKVLQYCPAIGVAAGVKPAGNSHDGAAMGRFPCGQSGSSPGPVGSNGSWRGMHMG